MSRIFSSAEPGPQLTWTAMMSIVTLNTDAYSVIFDDTDVVDEITCAFNRFNGALFDDHLPETRVRWASSIVNRRAPGCLIGLLAMPDDPQSFRLPNQFQLKMPHIFITERIRGLSPLDEWVLLHEMCHFRVPHHGEEFIEELKRVLIKNEWRVLLGGY
jgi:hypothetical protein